MGWEAGGRFKREGTNVYLGLLNIDTGQKLTQYCKEIILQLKIKNIWVPKIAGVMGDKLGVLD